MMCPRTNARCLIVMVTESVSTESVSARLASVAKTAEKVISNPASVDLVGSKLISV